MLIVSPDELRGPADDPGATILIPTPGGARAAFMAAAATPAPMLSASGGLNPLLRAANPLIELALPLRQLPTHPNVEDLRNQLMQMVRNFEVQGRANGID
ncbi:MAG TPA: DotU family type IV/VI secretion system protein, partial [Paraburkholderia sp.]